MFLRSRSSALVKVRGPWCYLYRAMDQAGDFIDARLSQTRDLAAANAFFAQAQQVAGHAPERVVTDGLRSYPRAIAEVLGSEVEHEQVSCTANPVEQAHRGIRQRYFRRWVSTPLTPRSAFAV